MFRDQHPDALLVPDGAHSKLAVGTGYAAEVPSGEVGEHRVPLEAQPPAQSRCVKYLVVCGQLYPVQVGLFTMSAIIQKL